MTTYSNIHFVLLMRIHLDMLRIDVLCPEVEGL